MSSSKQLAKEYPPANEAKSIEDLWNLQLQLMKSVPDGTSLRGQHAKGHGCAKATFELNHDMPDWAATGIFEPGKKYDAVVRFSNGFSRDDRKPDIHGIAIKLFGVPERAFTNGVPNSDIKRIEFP